MKKLILSFVVLSSLCLGGHAAFAASAPRDDEGPFLSPGAQMPVSAPEAAPTPAADEPAPCVAEVAPVSDPVPAAAPVIVAIPAAEPVSQPVTTATVVSPAVVDSSYKIIPGDVLQIDVWKEDGLNQEVLVLPDGMITFPLVGSFSVNNMTPEDVQTAIKKKLKKYIPDATVTVSVKAALGHTVSVLGQVTKPGEFIISHGLTVMQALSQAGGLTPYADESDVIVLRRSSDGVETSIPFPYDDIARGRHLDKDVTLNPGDVVVVPTTSLF